MLQESVAQAPLSLLRSATLHFTKRAEPIVNEILLPEFLHLLIELTTDNHLFINSETLVILFVKSIIVIFPLPRISNPPNKNNRATTNSEKNIVTIKNRRKKNPT